MSIKITDLTNYTNPSSEDPLAIVDVSSNVTKKIQAGELVNTFVPVGMVVDYAGSSAPTNWLLCDGSAVSRTTYADLFAAIGTQFGAGDGTTTFNLPDARNRVVAGKGTDTEFNALGKTGGAKSANLSHSHTVNSHNHFNGSVLSGATSVNHSHGGVARGGSFTDGQTPDHQHAYDRSTGFQSPGTSSSLSSAQSLLSPYITLNKIIKAV